MLYIYIYIPSMSTVFANVANGHSVFANGHGFFANGHGFFANVHGFLANGHGFGDGHQVFQPPPSSLHPPRSGALQSSLWGSHDDATPPQKELGMRRKGLFWPRPPNSGLETVGLGQMRASTPPLLTLFRLEWFEGRVGKTKTLG